MSNENIDAVKTANAAAEANAVKKASEALAASAATAAADEARATVESNAKAMTAMEAVIADLEALISFYKNTQGIEANLTPEERKRLISSRVRNNGFMDKAFDIGISNPQYLPPFLSKEGLVSSMHVFEDSRQIMYLSEQLLHIATDKFMVQSNGAYRIGLRIYGFLKEQSKAGIVGAVDLFDNLLNYFTHRRRAGEKPEETQKELDEDFHKLEHGKAEGEMVVRSEMPHTSGGGHEVVDNIHGGHSDVDLSAGESKKS